MLKLHTLKPKKGTNKKKKRVGRGGSHGTTATRGTKGQKSRSGYTRRFGFEGGRTSSIMQLPKLRGFTSLQPPAQAVTLGQLEIAFKEGDAVTSASLKKHELISSRNEKWRIVVRGDLKKKLSVFGNVSEGAEKVITAAGGTVTKIVAKKEDKKVSKKKTEKK